MRKQPSRSQLILGFLALILPIVCAAGPRVQECQKRPEFFHRTKSSLLKNMESLPRLVFVAREADYYVENKNQTFKIWGQQSFTRVESKILCANISGEEKPNSSMSFSIYAPTLIDLTGGQKAGDSFWQFHLNVDGSKLGIWNQITRLSQTTTKDFETQMSKIGVQAQVFQIAHNEFGLILKREVNSFIEALYIRFEAVSEIP